MTPDIQDQIDLEKRMVSYGVNRYKVGVDKAQEKGRGGDIQSAQKLMQEFVTPVAAAIAEWCNSKQAGRKAKYRTLLKVVEPEQAAYLGLRAVFDHFTHQTALVSLASRIGMLVEDEAKFSKFHETHADYYEAIIADFKRKGTVNYRHMHRVLTMKAKSHEVKWNDWTNEERIAVGVKVIDLIMQSTDLIEKRYEKSKSRQARMQIIISPTDDCLKWMKDFDQYAQLLNPDRCPCIIQPDPWISVDQGGYFTPQLRRRTPMVKVKNKEHMKLFEGDMSSIMKAVNILQDTAWEVNTEVCSVLKTVWDKSLPIGLPQSEPFPIPNCPVAKNLKKADMSASQREEFDEWKAEARVVHTLNKERVSKCFQVIRVLRTAQEFKEYERFWFVYQCDFRGRIYATVSGLSPQGPDFAKALLRFSEGKALTERGLYWLRIHGANTYGEDKVSYADRVEWVKTHERQIKETAEDPISNKDFWGNADKPWQFLAFCLEYNKFLREGLGMASHLPIGLDGTCNGLQNFSAMLADATGGKAVNLTVSSIPNDIYSTVAEVCTAKLRGNKDPLARIWLDFAETQPGRILPRGLTKRPVMTLPYGSTQQSCREYIYKFMLEDEPDAFPKDIRFKLSIFLTPILWESIGEVVVAARKAMDWIQRCASRVAKENKPLVWETPIGFPVWQGRKRVISKRVETELAGKIRLRLNADSDQIDVQKQRLGAAPNFVHSMDACHLMMTILKVNELGVHNLACIHDDFGTHAEDTDKLHTALRWAFVELYSENDVLANFRDSLQSTVEQPLPPMPVKGNLDLREILSSPYFFG
jgi:DNA-directed RNA polymerase